MQSDTPFDYKKKISYYKIYRLFHLNQSIKKFFNFKLGRLEKIEGIELMRSLENNQSLGVYNQGDDFAADVNADLLKAIDVMPKDKFRNANFIL